MEGFWRGPRAAWDIRWLNKKPFCRGHAFSWLCAMATFAEERVQDFHGLPIRLFKNQLVTSLRDMAKAWGWTKDKCEVFVNNLISLHLIRQEIRHEYRIITICSDIVSDKVSDTKSDNDPTTTRQRPDITEEGSKKVKKEKNTPLPPLEGGPLAEWYRYRKEMHKPLTASGLETLRKKYANRPEALAAAVSWSISKGYQGLFDPPPSTASGKKETNIDRAKQVLLETLEEERNEEIGHSQIIGDIFGSLPVVRSN